MTQQTTAVETKGAIKERAPGPRVLVVEDEAVIARAIAETLTAAQFTITDVVSTTEEALYSAKIAPPELAVVDIVLADRNDGVSCAASLRLDSDVAILFLTSLSDEATLGRALALAPNGFLIKPFRRQDLVASARTALANRQARPPTTDLIDLATVTDKNGAGLAPAKAARVRQYVERHFDRALRVSELASLCGMSEAHFTTRFKRSFGVPPHRYIVQQRIEEAQHLLRTTSLPYADIAKAVGYGNAAYFSVVFRRETGVSPSSFRQC